MLKELLQARNTREENKRGEEKKKRKKEKKTTKTNPKQLRKWQQENSY